MKIKLLALVLMTCIIFTGCGSFPLGEAEYVCSIDTDRYIYGDDVAINLFELHDTLEIYVDSNDGAESWRWLLAGFIKRFTYVDGVLIIQYYDKWYTFDVENYEPENKSFDLKEYSLDELEEVYPDLESFEWKVGRYERNDENIKDNQWYNGFKITIPYYVDTVPEFVNIGASVNVN